MLDLDTRRAILHLRRKGHGVRAIARALEIARNSVRRVVRSGEAEVPRVERAEKGREHLERVRELYGRCKGNRVRVLEELEREEGVEMAYSTLTGLCRRHRIGVKVKERAGRYHFGPGEEMQHDTSPHRVQVGGKKRKLECASLVLCYSRMLYAQTYPVWNRFHCKVFLSEALEWFGGSAGRCMIDNSSVVIARGTGKQAVPAPEMAALAERFGFHFEAHELGDANRSARVERPFHYIERNFYPGREFAQIKDLNAQLRAWCERVNGKYRRHLKAKPVELFAVERAELQALPLHIPEVYQLHHRTVDVEGYVAVHRNRYSVDEEWIGRSVEVRESKDRIRVFAGHREVAVHERQEPGVELRKTLPEHRRRGRKARSEGPPLREEKELRAAGPELAALVEALRKRHGGRAVRPLRRLYRMFVDYPDEPLRQAVARSLEYGLLELDRIEKMVLRQIAGEYFRLAPTEPEDGDDG